MRKRIAVLALVAFVALQQHTAAQFPGQPQRIVLLIDSSNATQRMVIPMRAGLLAFLDALPSGPELAFVTTGGQMRPRVRPTGLRSEIRKAMESFASEGGANAFIDGLSEAYDRFLKPAEDKRPIFVIVTTESTAGRDGEVNVDRYNRFNQSFRNRGGRAHAIVIGGLDRGNITDVARHVVESTGGRFERIADPTALPKLLT